MNELKAKWEKLETPIKIGVIAAAVVVGLIFILKILPALIAAMGIGLLLVILFVPYWLPTIIAFVRKHPSKAGILAVNFFFGWTFIGWVLSLAWALSDNTARGGHQTVIVNTTVAANPQPYPQQYPQQYPPQYQIGDVVNGQRFDGTYWIPLPTSPVAPPVARGTSEMGA